MVFKMQLDMQKQQGAALVVGLIVLLVMTLIGVSSMSSITTEVKIAGNVQNHNTAFQAASGIIVAALDDDTNSIDWTLKTPQGPVVYADPDISAEAMVTFSDCREAATGFSLTMDQNFKGVVHEIRGVGNALKNGDTLSTNTQVLGVQTIRPGC